MAEINENVKLLTVMMANISQDENKSVGNNLVYTELISVY